ncbi:MAG: hypothetical protein KatS3mg129_2268 [Leptospiraceae bacterium]|nr:MAG: hypothetical protein KatS3mg129_2268 [Leptospiraceae bacterium]
MIILFSTFLGNNKIVLDILFIIKDTIHDVFDNRLNINPNIHLEKRYFKKAIKNRHNRCIIRNKRNNNIYKAS